MKPVSAASGGAAGSAAGSAARGAAGGAAARGAGGGGRACRCCCCCCNACCTCCCACCACCACCCACCACCGGWVPLGSPPLLLAPLPPPPSPLPTPPPPSPPSPALPPPPPSEPPSLSARPGAQHRGQYHSPSGTARRGGEQQRVWQAVSQPSPSQNSIQLPPIHSPLSLKPGSLHAWMPHTSQRSPSGSTTSRLCRAGCCVEVQARDAGPASRRSGGLRVREPSG